MDDKTAKRIAYDIAKARILLQAGDIEGVAGLLDDAADAMPDEHWPEVAEMENQ